MLVSLLTVAAASLVFHAAPPQAPVAAPADEGRIAVYRLGRIDLLDPQGRPRGTLPARSSARSGADAVTLSADGARVAFVRDEAIWVAAADGSPARRLIDGIGASWSPDGRTLAVTRLDPPVTNEGRHAHLWLVDADTAQARQLPLAGDAYGASWFPDGTRLATTETVYGPQDVSLFVTVIGADGAGARRLTDTGLDGGPVVSPDGSRIAFGSGRDRNGEVCGDLCHSATEIYTMAVDGSAPQRLSRTVADDTPLTWSPDGTRLVAYRAVDRPRYGSDLVQLNADGTCATWLTRSLAFEGGATWLPGSAPGPLDCSDGPAYPPPPEGPSHGDLSWLRAFTAHPVWWLGPRRGSLDVVDVIANDHGAWAIYHCRPYAARCRSGPQVQTRLHDPPLACRPGTDSHVRAVRVRGRTAWYSRGSLHLLLGRVWVRIEGNLPRALRFASQLRNAAAAGPHPALDEPLPPAAPGIADPDCPAEP